MRRQTLQMPGLKLAPRLRWQLQMRQVQTQVQQVQQVQMRMQ